MIDQAPSRTHIPALDGIRGLAILLVFVYHAFQFSQLRNEGRFDATVSRITGAGWAGVDLFFVLSGFLITGILLDSKRGPGLAASLGSFYGRRALRILPLYFAFLLAFMYVLPLLAGAWEHPDIQILRDHQAWYWTFTLNIKLAIEPLDNLGRFSHGHLWSLNVEEQFYLLWPIAILAIPRRALLPALTALVVAAPLFRFALLQDAIPQISHGLSAYVLMPARMDALAFGGIVALLLRDARWNAPQPMLDAVALAAVAMLTGLIVVYGRLYVFDRWTQIGGYTALAVCFAWLIAHSLRMREDALLARALTFRPLRFLGHISYALYVFHWVIASELSRRWTPAEHLGTNLPGRIAFTLVAGVISVALAWASWHLIEQRFLALKRHLPDAARG